MKGKELMQRILGESGWHTAESVEFSCCACLVGCLFTSGCRAIDGVLLGFCMFLVVAL